MHKKIMAIYSFINKVKRWKLMFLILLVAVMSIAVINWIKFLEVDQCLDSGGQYHYEKSACVYNP